MTPEKKHMPELTDEQIMAASAAMSGCGYRHWRGDVTEQECIESIWAAICSSAPLPKMKSTSRAILGRAR